MTTSTFSHAHRLLAVVLIGALGFLAACDSETTVEPEPPPPLEDDGTIADIVADNENFSTLLSLLQDEGLADALGDEDATFTVFAPTNTAFEPFNLDAIGAADAAGDILRYHVVEGAAVAAGDLEDGQTIETLAGDELTVSLRDGDVFIDGSQVSQADLEADNGIIHVIDRTLIGNQNLANVTWFVNQTQALYNAVLDAELGEAFAEAEEWTVFGPNNGAFDDADLSAFSEEEIAEILQYHAIAGQTTTSTELLSLLESEGEVELETLLEGETITAALDGEEVVFNNGQASLDVVNLDYFASNGILHVIDGILLPPDLAPAEVELQTQALDFTADDSELLVTGITATAGQTVVITTDDGDGDFTNEDVVGSLELTENLQDGSVLVDVAGADPVDHAAHISTDGTVEGVTATSETAAVYALAQFTWNDESYDEPTNTVTVDVIEILYNGTIGEDLVSIDLHAVNDGEIGAFVGISQEDLAINTVHNDVTIDVLEPRGGGDDSPREESTIDQTAEFFAMTHLGPAGTDANGERIPAQAPALLTTANGNLAPLVGDFATVEILGEATVTIADIVAENEDFSTLLTALQEADLVDPLADEDATFTVFAPNNAAFGPINVDVLIQQPALADVLGYHVVSGQAIAAGDLQEGENTVTTLAGDELTVVRDGDDVFIEGSQVIQADIETDNGIIHVIDRTLLGNQNLANVAWFVDETFELYNAVVDFDLADAFVNADDWTVFGPNNATFDEADLSGFSQEEVQEVLQYHVFADDAVDSASLLALLDDQGGEITLGTAQGEDLTIALDSEQVVFNDGQATLDVANLDYFASNGILHVIDGLLLPPSFTADDAAVTITLDNDGASAYFATAVDGADAASVVELNENNATITLSVGTRYTFDIVNGGPHPFAVEDGEGNDLLTHDGAGTFATDEDVNLETDGAGGFSFTLTQELAEDLAEYYCAVHTGSMRGSFTIQ